MLRPPSTLMLGVSLSLCNPSIMKGKRIDNKTRAKLIAKRINEDKDVKDIAKEMWINERTAQHIIKEELADVCVKSDKVAQLIDRNNFLQSLADARITTMLQSEESSVKVSELVSVRDSAFKQNQLIGGKPTWILSVQEFDHITRLVDDLHK